MRARWAAVASALALFGACVDAAWAADATSTTTTPTATSPATTTTPTSTTPTSTTPTTTSPTSTTPTTTTPTTTTPSSLNTPSAAGEYVEQIPTSSGSLPTSSGPRNNSGVGTNVQSLEKVAPTLATKKPGGHRSRRGHHSHVYTLQQAGDSKSESGVSPPVVAAPASSPATGTAHLIWLLAAMIVVTVLALGGVRYQRRRAGI